MKVRFREFAPSPALAADMECFWYRTFTGGPDDISPLQHRVPLGMPEIVVHANGNASYLHFGEPDFRDIPVAAVVGIHREGAAWKVRGTTKRFGIRLKPESILRLFKVPATSLFNRYTDVDTFFGRSLNSLVDQLMGEEDPAALVRITGEYLSRQLRHMDQERNYLAEATRIIHQSKGDITLEALSHSLYVSERQLQRSVKEILGTSPKTYTRIVRFRHAYTYLQRQKDRLSWTDLTYHCGYADHAHFIKDFQNFLGRIPTSVVGNDIEFYQMNGALAS